MNWACKTISACCKIKSEKNQDTIKTCAEKKSLKVVIEIQSTDFEMLDDDTLTTFWSERLIK